MRLWEKLVSLAALSVIVVGAAYAYGRERLANTEPSVPTNQSAVFQRRVVRRSGRMANDG